MVHAGGRATIGGLVSKPEHNGKCVVIRAFDEIGGRFQCELEDGTVLRVRSNNLTALRDIPYSGAPISSSAAVPSSSVEPQFYAIDAVAMRRKPVASLQRLWEAGQITEIGIRYQNAPSCQTRLFAATIANHLELMQCQCTREVALRAAAAAPHPRPGTSVRAS